MRPARRLLHLAAVVEAVEPAIAVGLQHAAEPGEMRLGMLGPAVRAVAVEHGGRGRAAMRPLVAEIGPEPAGAGLAEARGEDRHRRVVGMQHGARQDMPGQRIDQRPQQRRRLADPIGQGRALQLDALAGVDLALAVQRQVVGVLGHQHMGEQPRRGAAAADRQARRRGLGDGLAAAAGELRPDMPDHAEPARQVVQHLGHVLAEAAQRAAAGRAGMRLGAVLHHLARQVLRQRAAGRLAALWPGRGVRRILGGCRGGRLRLQLLERQLQLVGLGRQPLRRAAELQPPQPGQLQPEPLDQRALIGQRRGLRQHDGAQRVGVVGQGGEIDDHDGMIGDATALMPNESPASRRYPAISGRQVRAGMRQSMPSSSIESCAGVSDTTPSLACGQTKWPRSSRLA